MSKVMERDLSEAHKTIKHAHYCSLQLNWDRHYSISLPLQYRKEKKNGNYVMESIYFFQIGFVNLYEYVAILLIFFPLSGFPSVQISSIAAGATVYYYQLDNNKKRYMTYNTYTVGFFNLIIVLIWQLFLLNFLEILVSCQRRETVQSYSP